MKKIITGNKNTSEFDKDEERKRQLEECSDNSLEYQSKLYDFYQEDKKALIDERDFNKFKSSMNSFVKNYIPFIKLDWEACLSSLLETHRLFAIIFMVILKQHYILPSDCSGFDTFEKYQEYLNDYESLDQDFKKENLNILKKYEGETKGFTKLEDNEKTFYILKLDCASYIKDNEETQYNAVDVSQGVVIINGLRYKSDFPLDELYYMEISNDTDN